MMGASDHRFEADRLMVIVGDRLSDLVRKGEVHARYYNPGELFREVHLVMTNDDRPDLQAVQRMVGAARLCVHNLPAKSRYFLRTLGWQLPLLRPYLDRAVALARDIKPTLVRTHNNFIEGVMARDIKRALGVPYVISLHGVWDVDDRTTLHERIRSKFREKLERAALTSADVAIAVYTPIERYARAYGAGRVELIYNIVSGAAVERKQDYALSGRPRLLTINRQVPEKNPENIIRAVAKLDCHYTLVGDGPLHGRLQALASECGCADRVQFIKSIPNVVLCKMLKDFDVIVSHCDYWGMSKTIIEAGLTGLPIVINRHPKNPIEEYAGGWIVQCENTPEGYAAAIGDLLGSEPKRRALGARAAQMARDRFDPAVMEARTVALYRDIIGRVAC